MFRIFKKTHKIALYSYTHKIFDLTASFARHLFQKLHLSYKLFQSIDNKT